MDILELQYEILSRLSSQCDRLNLTDFQLETGESAQTSKQPLALSGHMSHIS